MSVALEHLAVPILTLYAGFVLALAMTVYTPWRSAHALLGGHGSAMTFLSALMVCATSRRRGQSRKLLESVQVPACCADGCFLACGKSAPYTADGDDLEDFDDDLVCSLDVSLHRLRNLDGHLYLPPLYHGIMPL